MLITVTNPFKERQYHAEVILPGSGPAQKVGLRPAFVPTIKSMAFCAFAAA